MTTLDIDRYSETMIDFTHRFIRHPARHPLLTDAVRSSVGSRITPGSVFLILAQRLMALGVAFVVVLGLGLGLSLGLTSTAMAAANASVFPPQDPEVLEPVAIDASSAPWPITTQIGTNQGTATMAHPGVVSGATALLHQTKKEENDTCVLPSRAQAAKGRALRFAFSSFNLEGDKEMLIPSLKRIFTPSLLGQAVDIREYTDEALAAAIQRGEVDAVLSSSGLYRANAMHGLRSIATVVCDEQPDPNRNEGALMVVRKDSSIDALADLKGKVLLANDPTSFSGYQIPMREFARVGINPETVFSKTHFYHRSLVNLEILQDLVAGKGDVGFLSLCSFEQLQKTHPELTKAVRIIHEEIDDLTSCRHSTTLYPAVTLSVTPSISASLSRLITVELLKLPKQNNGLMWSVASDFKSVDDLMRDLKLGPYEYLRHWGLERLLRDYWMWLLGVVVVIIALMLHSVRVATLVRRRETELKALHATQLVERAKLDRLQKAGAVGQISSLVAHELRQPLGAISLYAQGLDNLARQEVLTKENLREVLHEIIQDAQRASDIVERVRAVARKEHPAEVVALDAVMRRVISLVPKCEVGDVPLLCAPLPAVHVFANRLELEMALLNLIKNALEATARDTPSGAQPSDEPLPSRHAEENIAVNRDCSAEKEKPHVRVSWECSRETPPSITLAIEDRGPVISEEAFALLNDSVSSLKPQGLGLGLAIAKNVIERLGGRVTFTRNTSQTGLTTWVTLPLWTAPAEKVKTTTTTTPDSSQDNP